MKMNGKRMKSKENRKERETTDNRRLQRRQRRMDYLYLDNNIDGKESNIYVFVRFKVDGWLVG